MSVFWKIEETVGVGYIVHPDTYATGVACQAAIDQLPSNSGCRAQLYQTGKWNGPIRVEENTNE